MSRRALIGVAAVLGVMLLLTVVGIGAYNAGEAHAIAEAGVPAGEAIDHTWRGHYGGPGWFFFPFFPFLFILLFVLLLKGLFWGGPRHYAGPGGRRARLEEWHREAHRSETQRSEDHRSEDQGPPKTDA